MLSADALMGLAGAELLADEFNEHGAAKSAFEIEADASLGEIQSEQVSLAEYDSFSEANDIQLAGAESDVASAIHRVINRDEADAYADASESGVVYIGDENLSEILVIEDESAQGIIEFRGNLTVLRGDEIHVNSNIVAHDLVFAGDGTTVPLNADITDTNSVTFSDSVIVNGARSVQSDTQITFNAPGVTVEGNGGSDDDLSLNAGGAIVSNLAIGGPNAIRNLSLQAGTSINLTQSVEVVGNFTVSGATTATFRGNVNVEGDMTITGVGQVSFDGDVTVGGTITIVTDSGSISFDGDLISGGNISLTAPDDANIAIDGSVTADSGDADLTIGNAQNVDFGSDVTVARLTQSAGAGSTTFDREVNADQVEITTTTQIRFRDQLNVGGDVSVAATQVDLDDPADIDGALTMTSGEAFTVDNTLDVGGNVLLSGLDRVTILGDATFGGTVSITTVNDGITFGGKLTSDAAVTLETPDDASILLVDNVNVNSGADDFTINLTRNATFSGSVAVRDLTVTDAKGTVVISGQLTADDISITSAISVLMATTVNATGSMTIFSEEINFGGNTGSVNGGGLTSVLTLAPYSPSSTTSIDIGSPVTNSGVLDISDSDFRAIANNWDRVVLGHLNTGMGTVRVGTLLLTQTTSVINTLQIHGGSIIVEEAIELSTSGVDYLLLKANDASGNGVVIDGGIGQTSSVRNAWVRIESQADVRVNAPVYASERISIATGFDTDLAAGNDSGDIIIDGSGSNTGLLATSNALANGVIELVGGAVSGDLIFRDTTVTAAGANSALKLYAPAGSIDGTTDESLLTANSLSVEVDGSIALNTAVSEILQTSVSARSDISAIDDHIFHGASSQSLGGLQSTGSGSIDLSNEGSLSIGAGSGGIDAPDGSVRIEVTGEGNDLTLNDSIIASGDITLIAADDINQNDEILSTTGDVSLSATAGSITMLDGVSTTAVDGAQTGHITYTAGSDIALSILEADGTVSLTAEAGRITDNLTAETANILGGTTQLEMSAGAGIGSGSGDAEIDTTVATVSAEVLNSGGLYLEESDSLIVSSGGITVSGTEGDVVLETVDGSLTVNGAITTTGASGNVLLSTNESVGATDASIYQNAALTASGDISLITPDAILQSADGDISATTSGSTIDLLAGNAITQADGTEVSSTDGDIRLSSSGTGDITIGRLSAGTASVALQNVSGSLIDTSDADAVDVQSSGLLIAVSGDVASAANPLEIASATLSVLSSGGAAGIFITESDSLTIDRVDVTIERVAVDGSSTAITTESQEDLRATIGGIVLQVLDGSLQVNDGDLAADNTGVFAALNILLQTSEVAEGGANSSNLTLAAQVVSSGGSISLVSSDLIVQETATGDITTQSAGKTIDLLAGGGIRQVDGASATTHTGDIFLTATTGDIVLGQVLALGANVAVNAVTGSILDLDTDTNDADIRTNGLILTAGNNIGSGSNLLETEVSTLSTQSGGSEGSFISELDALTITENSATVERIGADAQVASNPSVTQSDLESSNDGAIVLVSGGALTLNEGSADDEVVNASGNVLLRTTAGAITVNAPVLSAGNVRIDSAAAITQAALGDITLSAASKTLYVSAAQAITLSDGAFAQTNDGDIRYESANGDITLGQLIAGAGNVALIADTGSIVDGGDTGGEDIQSSGLLITAGTHIASAANHLETLVARLSTLSSTSASSNGVFITESNGLIVDSITVAVQSIESDGVTPAATTDTTQADLDTSLGGAVVVQVNSGDFQLTDGASSDADGITVTSAANVLLNAISGQLIVDADVISTTGHLTLQASDDIRLSAEADLSTQTATQTILIESGSDVLMSDGASVNSTNGDIVIVATDSITVGDLTAGAASVSLRGSSITDSGSSDTDVTAAELRLEAESATGAAGASDNHLEIDVNVLSALTGTGGVFITETDGLQIDTVSVITANRIGSAGTVIAAVTESAQEDVVTTGALVLDVTSGDLTINGGSDNAALSASSNLRLSTAAGNIAVNALVVSTAGSIYLAASGNVTQAAAGSLQSQSTAETIYVLAGAAISMTDGSQAQSTNGDIRYEAKGGDITLAQLLAGTADVAVIASAGSVLDLAGDSNDEDIRAAGLLITASNNIGSGSDHLETAVDTLSTQSSGSAGTFISESDSVTVGNVSVDVNVVSSAAATSNANAAQDTLTATSDGSIVLVTATGGTITLSSNVSADDNILLQAGLDLLAQANADITSTASHITLTAARTIDLGANVDVTTSSTGTLDLAAATGDIVMNESATLNTVDGDIRLTGGDDILDQIIVGDIFASNANVSIEAAGSVFDTADADNEVTALTLRIVAGKGVGLLAGNSLTAAVNAFETSVDRLSILVQGSDGINIAEEDGLTVDDTTAVSVETVDTDSTTDTSNENSQSDLVTTDDNGSDGSIVVRVLAGDLILTEGTATDDLSGDAAVLADGSGNILLAVEGSDADLLAQASADVETSSGHLTLSATRTIDLAANVDVTTAVSGTIDVLASEGDIVMDESATLNTVNGDIRLTGGDDVADQIVVGDIFATNADVSIEAAGSVLDTSDTDNEVTALTLRIVAGKGVGLLAGNSLTAAVNSFETAVGTLSAWVRGSDGVNILEDDALTLGNTAAVSVETVDTDASTSTNTENSQSDVITTNDHGADGSIVIRTEAGDLTVTEGSANSDVADVAISAHGAGNILLAAEGAGTDILAQANADIESTTGHITLTAARTIDLGANVDVTTSSTGTLDLAAATGDIVMNESAALNTVDGDIRLTGGDDILDQIIVGDIFASNANVSIEAAGSVLDTADADNEVTALTLRIVAGKGVGLLAGNSLTAAVNAFETSVDRLSILVQGSDGINIAEEDRLTIDDTTAVSVETVDTDSTTDTSNENSQSDLVTTDDNGSDGSIVVRVLAGDLILTEGTATDDLSGDAAVLANGSGNILLTVEGSDADLLAQANADVETSSGHLTLSATRTIDLAANVDVTTAASGTIDVLASEGDIVMDESATLNTVNGDIRLTGGDDVADQIVVGDIFATNADVSIEAAGSVLDTSDTDNEVTALTLRIVAGKGVGLLAGNSLSAAVNSFETAVSALSAWVRGSDGVNILEDDALTLGNTAAVSVETVDTDASTSTNTENSQSDVITTADHGINGSIVIRTEAGDLTLTVGSANSDVAGVAISAHGAGNILLAAEGVGTDILAQANADIESTTGHITLTAARTIDLGANVDVSTAGDILLSALTGAIIMDGRVNIEATAASLRLASNLDLTIGNLTAAEVSLVSGGNILNATGSTKNVTADKLRVEANGSVGESDNYLSTNIDQLSVSSLVGSIFVHEDNAATVTDVEVVVTEVLVDSSSDTITDESQSDLTTGANGDIILLATSGNLTLDDGVDADGRVVSANGSGRILIDALNGSLTANSDVLSDTGIITLAAALHLDLTAAVDVATTADVSLNAAAGALTMAGSANVTATNASARLAANLDLTVGNVTALNASLVAGGSILNAVGSTKNVTANQLRISAFGSIGESDHHLTTNIDDLSANALNGSIFITEDNAVTVTNVTVTVNELRPDASTDLVLDATQSDLSTGSNGDIVLTSEQGNITLTDGSDADATAISANGSGRILIESQSGSLTSNASILSDTGIITLTGASDVALSSTVAVSTAADISITAQSGGLTMAGNAAVSASNASARLASALDLTLGNVTANAVSLVSGNNILNANGSPTNVTATELRVEATGSIGTAGNHLSTDIANLSAASATGSIFITEADAVTVSDVAVSVTEFASDANTTVQTDAAQSDLSTAQNGDIILIASAGNILLTDGSNANNQAVSANGSGRILIVALDGSLTANANILSDSGILTLSAEEALTLNAVVAVSTAADISLESQSGALTMAADASVTATGASARLASALNLSIGQVTANAVSLLSGANIISAAGSPTNVIANSLRIAAGGSVGTAATHLSTDIDELSAAATTGSIFVSETDGLTVTNVSVSVSELESGATTTTVTDLAQSDLTAANHVVLVATAGNIILEDGSDVDGISVSAGGNILLESSNGSQSASADIRSSAGSISVIADMDLSFQSGADIAAMGTGTIELHAVNGTIDLATSANQSADSGDIRFRAASTITLGGTISTSGTVSLISDNGVLIDADTNSGLDIAASGLRVSAISFGSLINPIETDLAQFAAQTSNGGIYFSDAGDLTLGTASASIQHVASDASTTAIADLSLSGLIATSGAIAGTAAGTITLETVQSDSSIQLTSTGGRILDGGEASTDLVAPSVSLSAAAGLGENGSGALDIDTDLLDAQNTVSGSAYLKLLSTTTVSGIQVAGSGSLILQQVAGDLDLTGAITTSNGGISISTPGALTVDADIRTQSTLRTISDTLDVNAATLETTQGDLDIRVRGNADFAADSSLESGADASLMIGGSLGTGPMSVDGSLDILARGDILRNGGEIVATNLKIASATGQIGASTSDPLKTRVDRMDASAAGALNISEADGFDMGRSGLNTSGGDDVNLNLGGGSFGSVGGEVEHSGSGTFTVDSTGDLSVDTSILSTGDGGIDINSDGDLNIGGNIETGSGEIELTATGDLSVGGNIETDSGEIDINSDGNLSIEDTVSSNSGHIELTSTGNLSLADLVRSTSGDIVIAAAEIIDGTVTEDLLLSAPLGRVTLTATSGIGASGDGDIEIASAELSGRTGTGTLAIELRQNTSLVAEGLRIDSGNGLLSINQTTGSLSLIASVSHAGSGAIDLDTIGSLSMSATSRISTVSGAMDLRVNSDFFISQVFSTSGSIRVESVSGSVDKITGFNQPNIVSIHRPLIFVDQIADFVVNADTVSVNGGIVPRSTSTGLITIAINFS